MEKFESFETPPLTGEAVVEILDAHEPGSLEAMEAIGKYADQCHVEADAEAAADPENPAASNRANIKAEIKIALVCMKSEKHKEAARESLEQTLLAASQDDSTADLAEQIRDILDSA